MIGVCIKIRFSRIVRRSRKELYEQKIVCRNGCHYFNALDVFFSLRRSLHFTAFCSRWHTWWKPTDKLQFLSSLHPCIPSHQLRTFLHALFKSRIISTFCPYIFQNPDCFLQVGWLTFLPAIGIMMGGKSSFSTHYQSKGVCTKQRLLKRKEICHDL